MGYAQKKYLEVSLYLTSKGYATRLSKQPLDVYTKNRQHFFGLNAQSQSSYNDTKKTKHWLRPAEMWHKEKHAYLSQT